MEKATETAHKRGGIVRRWALTCLLPCAGLTAAVIAALVWLCLAAPLSAGGKIALAALGAAALIALSAALNLRFLRTVTGPVRELTDFSRRISAGSLGIQAVKPRDDEIGELFDSINALSSELARSERLQTEFISSVSHELRTPLTAITGWSETLIYDESIQGDSRRGISIILREAQRLSKMVGELLDFTRIQGGRFKLNMERMDPEAELADAVLTYSQLAVQENIALSYAPPDDPSPLINGDPERLKQVFLNIIDNALKHGAGGGRIDVAFAAVAGAVTVTVRDFGPGIAPDELGRVKERFYKGRGSGRGSGIGLAVCEEIVARHGGALAIANAEGGGVLVTVTLPVD